MSSRPDASIDVVPYSEAWPEQFEQERRALQEATGEAARANNTFVGSDAHLFLRKVTGGKRTHHLHVLRSDSPEIDDYRLFRDELCSDPALAAQYERLKVSLAREHASDRMRYVTEKAKLVNQLLAKLRQRRAR